MCGIRHLGFFFQTTLGEGGRVRNGCEFTLCPVDFAVQFVAFDVGNDFAVEADLVQVSAVVA